MNNMKILKKRIAPMWDFAIHELYSSQLMCNPPSVHNTESMCARIRNFIWSAIDRNEFSDSLCDLFNVSPNAVLIREAVRLASRDENPKYDDVIMLGKDIPLFKCILWSVLVIRQLRNDNVFILTPAGVTKFKGLFNDLCTTCTMNDFVDSYSLPAVECVYALNNPHMCLWATVGWLYLRGTTADDGCYVVSVSDSKPITLHIHGLNCIVIHDGVEMTDACPLGTNDAVWLLNMYMDVRMYIPLSKGSCKQLSQLSHYSDFGERTVFANMNSLSTDSVQVSVFTDALSGEIFVKVQGDAINDGIYLFEDDILVEMRDNNNTQDNETSKVSEEDVSYPEKLLNKYQEIYFPSGIPVREVVRLLNISNTLDTGLCVALENILEDVL